MPKQRIIACLVVKNGFVVQSIRFDTYLPIGRPEIAARFLNDWGIDEIVIVDIDATAENRTIAPDVVRTVSRSCFVPVAAGGGLRNADDIRTVLQSGADKIAVNTLVMNDPDTVWQASRIFGRQCIVASIDTQADGNGGYRVFNRARSGDTPISPVALARQAEEAGAGEILLNSVDRDGTKSGFDLALIDSVAGAVNIPVIALGGAGHPRHFHEALSRDGVSAVAAANYFHFTEHSASTLKSYLLDAGLDVRLDSQARYTGGTFDDQGRFGKLPDDILAEQIFEHIPEEII